jgi:hypothetical protein
MARYSDDWETIAAAVKEAAGWCCEHCGAAHDPASGYCLTVHHIDMDPLNCAGVNLVALCQRCHLHWQARFRPGQVLMTFARPGWLSRRGHGW